MALAGSRVAVIGGSIAGCASAIALRRCGCEVTVFERSGTGLHDRGQGIGLPLAVWKEFVELGYLSGSMPVVEITWRGWIVRDGDVPQGRLAWRQPLHMVVTNWGVIWGALREQIPVGAYREDTPIRDIRLLADGVEIATEDGGLERFDAVVGADGYRSTARSLLHPSAAPRYAGYAIWRADYPESWLPAPIPAEFEDCGVTICFPGGQGIFYLITGPDGEGRRVNFGIYDARSEPLTAGEAISAGVGQVPADLAAHFYRLLDEHFPPYWADVVRCAGPDGLSLQPVYDSTVPGYASGRLLLAGDAGAVARPHIGSGVAKALGDALALQRIGESAAGWDEALALYHRERRDANNEIVRLGQWLGHAQVQQGPQWATMGAEDFRAWWTTATPDGRPSLHAVRG